MDLTKSKEERGAFRSEWHWVFKYSASFYNLLEQPFIVPWDNNGLAVFVSFKAPRGDTVVYCH